MSSCITNWEESFDVYSVAGRCIVSYVVLRVAGIAWLNVTCLVWGGGQTSLGGGVILRDFPKKP